MLVFAVVSAETGKVVESFVRRELREAKHRLQNLPHRTARPLRKRHYIRHTSAANRRIEVGSGPYPRPGYLHVDTDPRAWHLEVRASAWDLPFPDEWASEILAIHALEHVPPSRLLDTLREWRRVLASGGFAQVHVPNVPELMGRFIECPVEEKWRITGAMLGMYCSPTVQTPEDLIVRADHQLLFDETVLRWAFETAGFREIQDLTETVEDSHTEAWREVIPHFSLIFRAYR